MIHVVAIDNRLEGDGSFWESLFRGLQSADTRRPLMLVVGASQATCDAVGFSDDGIQARVVPPAEATRYEQAMRTRTQAIVSKLTDVGIHSTGFLGSDKNIFVVSEAGTLRANHLESIVQWCDVGVVPVVVSAGRNSLGEIVDVHPLLASSVVTRRLNETVRNKHKIMACNVLLALNITTCLAQNFINADRVALSSVVDMIPDDPLLRVLTPEYCASRTGLSHVSRLGRMEFVGLFCGPDRE